jgi:Ca2+-binding EF-hand superfamily protein
VRKFLESKRFDRECRERFRRLDLDGNGTLSHQELLPLVVELANTASWAVTLEQCKQFAAIFDRDGNRELDLKEFMHFSRFVLLMSFLEEVGARSRCALVVQML